MKTLITVLGFLLTSSSFASGLPFIGSKIPFSTTPYCKTYGCSLDGKNRQYENPLTFYQTYNYSINVRGVKIGISRENDKLNSMGFVKLYNGTTNNQFYAIKDFLEMLSSGKVNTMDLTTCINYAQASTDRIDRQVKVLNKIYNYYCMKTDNFLYIYAYR